MHNLFRNAPNLGIGGDCTEHVILRVDNLSFPASINYIIIHFGTNSVKFNNPSDIANGILRVYFLIQSKFPNAQIIVTGLFRRSQTFSYFLQIVKNVNTELGNNCSLYQILFLKPNDDWLQENRKLDPQFFGTMIYIFLKLVIKSLQLHYSILFQCMKHLSRHYLIQKKSRNHFLHCRKPTSTF